MFKMRFVDPEALQAADELQKLHSMNAALYQENARLLQENEQLRQQGFDGFAAEIANLKSQIAQLNATVAALNSENDQLKVENQTLRSNVGDGGPANDKAITEIKRRFAKLYHPNDASRTTIEGLVRAEIFKEFWGELEAIEKKYRSK